MKRSTKENNILERLGQMEMLFMTNKNDQKEYKAPEAQNTSNIDIH